MIDLKEGKPYQIITNDNKHYVGYFLTGKQALMFRIGLDNKHMLLKTEIKKITELSPRDIETRKTTGKYFIY